MYIDIGMINLVNHHQGPQFSALLPLSAHF